MRIENDKSRGSFPDMKPVFIEDDLTVEKLPAGSKFNISMEKKIERIWHESQSLGWSFNFFSIRVLEVLIILHHRNKLPAPEKRTRKLTYKNRA